MKANFQPINLIAFIFFAFLHLFAYSQPNLVMNGAQICLDGTGPNDNCASTESRISLLTFDSGDGYSLDGLDPVFTEPLLLGTEVDYLDVVDSEVEAFVLNGHFMEVHFYNAASMYFDMQVVGKLGMFFSGGRTAFIKGCSSGHSLNNYLNEDNPCGSMSVFLNQADKVSIQTGIGTVLVIDELDDSTSFPPVDQVAKGNSISYEDPYALFPNEPITYQEGAELIEASQYQFIVAEKPECLAHQRAMTSNTCSARVSPLSDIYVCNNYVVVKEPGNLHASYFHFNRFLHVYIYYDNFTHEIVIWRFGRCATF